jgi:Flp pilus assembly protein TadG
MRTSCFRSSSPTSGRACDARDAVRAATSRLGDVSCRRGEQGAVLVHVAVAFTGLLAFSALTVDLGMLWAARTQAQNAADAAAFAAATALAYGDPLDGEVARASGRAVLASNQVWDRPASAAENVNLVTCPAGAPESGLCVRADVFRDTAHAAPLPAYFAPLFGVGTNQVRATATAQMVRGNSTPCLRPWAIADQWIDNEDTIAPIDTVWTPDDVFDLGRDVYVPPSQSSSGSGYTSAAWLGEQVRVTLANSLDSYPANVPGDVVFDLNLPRTGDTLPGESSFEANIRSCAGVPVSIGDVVATGFNHRSDTEVAVEQLIASDPGASWDGTRVVGSAFAVSPRLVPISLFDPDFYAATNHSQIGFSVRVTNIVGLFVEDYEGSTIIGRFLPMAGTLNQEATQVAAESSFLRTIVMVR